MFNISRFVVVNTGEQHKVQSTIDDFFIETKGLIEEMCGTHFGPTEFEIKSAELAYQSGQITADRVSYLIYKTRIVAAVMETRTPMNYVRYDFFRNLEALE